MSGKKRGPKAKATMEDLMRLLHMPPAARASDPHTSRGAKSVGLSEDRVAVLRLYRDAYKGKFGAEFQEGMTDYDLETLTGRQQNSYGKRRGEWCEEDFPCIIATEKTRPAPRSTAPCIVWIITELGLDACEMLDRMEMLGQL